MDDKPPRKIPVGRPWVKGQSGNPTGKPKGVGEVQRLARLYSKDAIEALVRIVRNGKASQPGATVAAAVALLDRGWGKAPSYVEVSAEVRGNLGDMSTADLLAIVAQGEAEEATPVPEETQH